MFAFAMMLLLAALFIVNAIDFHYRYQKALDREVMKGRYYSGGLLFDVARLMLYGHYCLFPARARRDGVDDVFGGLSRTPRLRLIFHWAAGIGGALLLVVSWVYGEWTGRF